MGIYLKHNFQHCLVLCQKIAKTEFFSYEKYNAGLKLM